MATGDNKDLKILYGRRGKRYSGLNPLVPDYALEAGAAVFDDFMLDVAVPTGNTATIQSFSDDSASSFTANVATNATIASTSDDSSAEIVATPVSPGTNATIDARSDDSVSAFTATVATNATVNGRSDDSSAAITATVATNATITAFSDDSTAGIIATPVSAGTNATITSYSDDSFASFIATVTGQTASGGFAPGQFRNYLSDDDLDRIRGEEKALVKEIKGLEAKAKKVRAAYALKDLGKALEDARRAEFELLQAKQRLDGLMLALSQSDDDEMGLINAIALML